MKNSTYELMRIERQKSIIEAAYKLFLSNGIGNTTMKDIANEAQTSRQTLYSYYKDIDEIIISVQGEVVKSMMLKDWDRSGYESSSAIDYLREYIKCILKVGENYPKEMMFMSQADLHFKLYPTNENLFDELKTVFDDLDNRKIVINKIIQGQNDGTIRTDKSSYEIYSTIINISLGLVARILLIEDRVDITSEIEPKIICCNFIDMIIEFIKK